MKKYVCPRCGSQMSSLAKRATVDRSLICTNCKYQMPVRDWYKMHQALRNLKRMEKKKS